MSLSEALGEGLMTTFVGLVIVFAVLIILMLVMMLMKVVFYNPTQRKKSKAEAAAVDKPDNDLASATVEASADDTELIAVLAAAVAACLDKPASKFNIKSYKRVGSNATAWNKAGVRDIIDSRF